MKKGYRFLFIIGWMVFYLAVIDIAVNTVFHYPGNPRDTSPSFFQGYFEYGRSVEGKLIRMTRPNEDGSAPVVEGGWLGGGSYRSLPSVALGTDTILIGMYGMSHVGELGNAIAKTSKGYVIRKFIAGGATPNWSYAAYEFDKGRHRADVVILGLMTDSVPMITATTGMTAYFDVSYPYTFPRYTVQNDQLLATWPPFYTVEGFREYLYDKSKWNRYRQWLKQNDKYYDPILFQRSLLDLSATFRLVRRAYAENKKRNMIQSVYTKEGFIEESEEITILRTIARTFAKSAREKNIIPIIYLVNNEGRADHLYKALKPVLDAYRIPYLSTHIICPPDNPRVFTGVNSHFIPSKDIELAREIIRIIKAEQGK